MQALGLRGVTGKPYLHPHFMDLSEERVQTAKADFVGADYDDDDNLLYYTNCHYSLTLSAVLDGFLFVRDQDCWIKLAFSLSPDSHLGQAKTMARKGS